MWRCYSVQLPCGAAVACSCRTRPMRPPLPHVAALRLPSPPTPRRRPRRRASWLPRRKPPPSSTAALAATRRPLGPSRRLPSPPFARPPSPCSCRPPRVSHPCALALCAVSRPGMVVRDVVARLARSVTGPVCLVCMCMVACGPAHTTCTSTRPRPGKERPVKCVRMSATPHDPTQNVSVDITRPPKNRPERS